MRLLNVHSLRLSEFHSGYIPSYVIASHRWNREEITFQELERSHENNDTRTNLLQKGCFKKIGGFAAFIKWNLPHIQWLWIDTCCINKRESQELSEAIMSMCRWYRDAELCLAYLEDVPGTSNVPPSVSQHAFSQSEWFRRGWTLQELLAPGTVVFLSQSWTVIGHKGTGRGISGIDMLSGPQLTNAVVYASGIPPSVLYDFEQCKNYSVKEKLSWMRGRSTSREEDMIYSLLGVFDVSMSILYGEGFDKAKKRLLREVDVGSGDYDYGPYNANRPRA